MFPLPFRNSCFGKTIEQLRSRTNIHLVSDVIRSERYSSNPKFKSFRIVNGEVAMVELGKSKLFWNKPTYIGVCVLELSKLHMYSFFYDVIMKRYGPERLSLCMTDTDSLLMAIQTLDIYKDMGEDLEHYDTSDYPPNHELFSLDRKKRPGAFKDELNSVQGIDFVGLRPKVYSLLAHDKSCKKTLKGVQRGYVKKHVNHDRYKACLFNETLSKATFYVIRSENHVLRTARLTKDSLSPYDDKRFIMKNTYQTLAYGHYRITEMQNANVQ